MRQTAHASDWSCMLDIPRMKLASADNWCGVLCCAAAVERCKLLEVQYILKELRQQQPFAPAQDFRVQQQQQPPAAQLQQLPEHQQVWGAANAAAPAQTQPLCQRLSVRVVLQRLPAAPAPDELLDEQEGFGDSSWQQRGLQGCGQTQQVAYTCQLEYPAFTLLVSTPPTHTPYSHR